MKLFLYSVLILVLSSCSPDVKLSKFQGKTMGTTYHIRYIGEGGDVSNSKLKDLVDLELKALNQTMSTYIPNSELSLFNKSESLDWRAISKSLLRVVKHALEVGKLSHGAFDPTIGPLVNLWGFGPKGKGRCQVLRP